MTVSAASSPVVLLTSAVDPAKAVAPTTANASADGSGEGFQLLLAQAAEGVRAAAGVELLTPNTVVTPAPTAAQSVAEDGNTLPLLTDLLPLAPAAQAAEGGEAPIKAASDKLVQEESKDPDDKDDADAGLTLLPPPLLPVAPPPPAVALPTAAAGAPATSATSATATGASEGVELATPMLKKAPPIVVPSSGGERVPANAGSLDAAQTAQATAALVKAGGDGATQQEASTDSDFDAMLKQFDAAPAATTGSVDSGRTVQQAARPYVNTAPTTATVSIPVAAEGWSDAVNDKVMWFSANKINSAEIHLNPPDLGPIQVRISTQQDQATVYFTSQHASVREALDQALPRLREMMGAQGIQLTDTGVGGQNSPRQQEYQGNPDGRPRSTPDGFFRDVGDSSEPVGVSSISAARIVRSGIDAYA